MTENTMKTIEPKKEVKELSLMPEIVFIVAYNHVFF